MKTVIITEKPSVAREYAKILQLTDAKKTEGFFEGHSERLKKDVLITWAFGHLIQLCEPAKQDGRWEKWDTKNLPMIPVEYRYEPIPDSAKQYSVIRDLYRRPDVEAIYYAGDSGREGIYIQALIRNQVFGKAGAPKQVDERVVWIDSFTEESILKGIREAKPYNAYLPMIESGYVRAIADWLIGMNVTQALTLACRSRTVIRTGRVMTPTLAMVVRRQKEFDAFSVTPFYGVAAGDGIYWKAVNPSRFENSGKLYNENGFLKREDAEALIADLMRDPRLRVMSVKITPKTEYAPYNYNLADLQAECSKRFHITPAQTLSVAQSLYEKQFTTYPRTDSRFLTAAVAKEYAAKFHYEVPSRYVDDSKVTDHYAIIPTFEGDAAKLEGLEKEVYERIRKRFLDTMKPPYKYDAITVNYLTRNGEPFFASWRKVTQLGFKQGEDVHAEKDADEEMISDRPIPKEGDILTVSQFTVREMETNPPKLYTTGSLILAMEKAGRLVEDEELRELIKTCGIGTSATRAGIIEKLQKSEFIKIAKNQVVTPTEEGFRIIAVTEGIDPTLTSPAKTAELEDILSSVCDGAKTRDSAQKTVNDYVKGVVSTILSKAEIASEYRSAGAAAGNGGSGKEYSCPCCGATLSSGRYGWFCAEKNGGCGFSFSYDVSPKGGRCSHKMTETDLEALITKGATPYYNFVWASGKSSRAAVGIDKEKKRTTYIFDDSKKGGGGTWKNVPSDRIQT